MRWLSLNLLKLLGVAVFLLAGSANSAQAAGLRVGITLHPYYSFVANIVGDRAEIIPLIGADANPHVYAP
ncbi:MAG: ABC transporter substrate-binding protein, partial [Gammaproteobacteria bacterium]|nr:ABC transporter substrate-binding protein [Gammaproteobacteria bacterium]